MRPTTHGGPLYTVSAGSAAARRPAGRTRKRARGAAAAAAEALLAARPRPRPARSCLDCRRSHGGHCAARVARTKSESDGGARAPWQGGGRAFEGLSGNHAPSDAVKSSPRLGMMVGKLVMKLSGINPGQLHPELASGVQTRLQATREGETRLGGWDRPGAADMRRKHAALVEHH